MRILNSSLVGEKPSENAAPSKALKITRRVLVVLTLLSLFMLITILLPALRYNSWFIHMWVYPVLAGVFLCCLMGVIITIVRGKIKKRLTKNIVTGVSVFVLTIIIAFAVTYTQLITSYFYHPIAYLDTPDGKYQVVLMENANLDDDGSEYPMLTLHPMLTNMYYLMIPNYQITDAGEYVLDENGNHIPNAAYVEGLKAVNWEATWENDRKVTVTITDISEGEHLSVSLDLRDYLAADAE